MVSISDTLRSLGLTDKEAQAYLTLLSVGSAPASIIGARLGIPKSTARYACQELVKKGLVSLSRREDVYLYAAEPPEKIVGRLEREKQRIERQQEAAQKIVGELQALARPAGALPQVRFYEGMAGIKEVFPGMLRDVPAGGEIQWFLRSIGPEDAAHLPPGVRYQDLDAILKRFTAERVRRKVRVRALALRSSETEAALPRDAAELRETRIVDGLPFEGSPVQVMLYGDRMCSVTVEHGSIFTCILRHPSIVAMHRTMFELCWNSASDPRRAR